MFWLLCWQSFTVLPQNKPVDSIDWLSSSSSKHWNFACTHVHLHSNLHLVLFILLPLLFMFCFPRDADGEKTETPKSFCLVRVAPKTPFMVLRLAFLVGTPPSMQQRVRMLAEWVLKGMLLDEKDVISSFSFIFGVIFLHLVSFFLLLLMIMCFCLESVLELPAKDGQLHFFHAHSFSGIADGPGTEESSGQSHVVSAASTSTAHGQSGCAAPGEECSEAQCFSFLAVYGLRTLRKVAT